MDFGIPTGRRSRDLEDKGSPPTAGQRGFITENTNQTEIVSRKVRKVTQRESNHRFTQTSTDDEARRCSSKLLTLNFNVSFSLNFPSTPNLSLLFYSQMRLAPHIRQAHMNLREIITDSIKYWEPRRRVYNIVLGLIVIYYALPVLIRQRELDSLGGFDYLGGTLGIFVLAVIANVLYSTAYIADIFIQMSDYGEVWKKFRWILLTVGITIAAIFTWIFSRGIFEPYGTW